MKYQTEGNEVQIADCIKSLSPPLGDLFVLKLCNSEGLGKKAFGVAYGCLESEIVLQRMFNSLFIAHS
jgi:hypothetical protein